MGTNRVSITVSTPAGAETVHGLLADGATSKMTWFISRSWFDFSVRMMGRRMMVSGVSMGFLVT